MSFQEELRKFYKMDDEDKASRAERFVNNIELLHACLGLSGETGEVVDIIKKHVAYGKDIDKQELLLELGDTLHYLSRIVDLCGFTLDEVMQGNIDKLNKRYPNGYNNLNAINQIEKKI